MENFTYNELGLFYIGVICGIVFIGAIVDFAIKHNKEK